MKHLNDEGFTHFSATVGHAIPESYLLEIGRSVFIWSQVEYTISAFAVSVQDKVWLESVAKLMKNTGLPFKTMVDIVRSRINRADENHRQVRILDDIEFLYIRRNEYLHGIWGRVSGAKGSAVGLQQWSKGSLDNFRHVPLEELVNFRKRCVQLLPEVHSLIEVLHGARGVTIDDDGIVSPIE